MSHLKLDLGLASYIERIALRIIGPQLDALEVASLSPEQMLLFAILGRSIQDALIPNLEYYGWRKNAKNKACKVREEAREWLASKDIKPWSCKWVCSHLNISEETIERVLAIPAIDLQPTVDAAIAVKMLRAEFASRGYPAQTFGKRAYRGAKKPTATKFLKTFAPRPQGLNGHHPQGQAGPESGEDE